MTIRSFAGNCGLLCATIAFAAMAPPIHAGVQEGVDAWRNGDYAAAVAEWQPLAESGDPDAQFNLGQAYKLGRGVPQDIERAQQLFGRAAAQGHLQAEANYGLIQFEDGNREEAMPYIIRAANRGEPRAQYVYGTALYNGDLAPRDWPRAYAMMTSAARAGLPQANASLRQMDQYIPIEQRDQGRDMAANMAQASPPVEIASAPSRSSASANPPQASPPFRVPPPPSAEPRPSSPANTPPQASPPFAPPASLPRAQPNPVSPPGTRPQASPPLAPPPATPLVGTQDRTTERPPARPSTAPQSGNWRIQLGAFRDRSGAERHWRTISSRVSQIASLQPYLVRAGPYTRLQAGPFATRSQAQQACNAARRGGSDCIATRRQ